MNADQLAPIVQQAQHNLDADRSWCLLHPDQALDLARAVQERDEALARLEQIAIAARRGLYELADHDLATVGGRLVEIEELCKTVP